MSTERLTAIAADIIAKHNGTAGSNDMHDWREAEDVLAALREAVAQNPGLLEELGLWKDKDDWGVTIFRLKERT